MMKTLTLAAALLTLGAPAALAVAKTPAAAFKGHELAKQAKISLADARAIALKARPGKVIDQELEKETGGSGLRYAFDMKTRAGTYEIGIDARTGKVLENGIETAAQEKAEVRAERAEKPRR